MPSQLKQQNFFGKWRLSAAALLAMVPAAACAHGPKSARIEPSWTEWPYAPEIIFLGFLVTAVYFAGWWKRRDRSGAPSPWRHASFFAGLAAMLAALVTPLDTLGEHSFAMHQVQHLLLAGVGPLLFMLATPQNLLVAGTPEAFRGALLAPLMKSATARFLVRIFTGPTAAVLLLVATLYLWHIPSVHNLAVLDAPTHYAMHVTMLLTGLIFFWRVFDPRPAPLGASYGVRLSMGLFATSAGVPLGAYLALKSRPLYMAYESTGRPWGLNALQDETLGGLIMWIPGGVVYALVLLIVIRLWSAREERWELLRRRGLETDSARSPRSGNGAVALGLCAIVFVVFTSVIVLASLNLIIP